MTVAIQEENKNQLQLPKFDYKDFYLNCWAHAIQCMTF